MSEVWEERRPGTGDREGGCGGAKPAEGPRWARRAVPKPGSPGLGGGPGTARPCPLPCRAPSNFGGKFGLGGAVEPEDGQGAGLVLGAVLLGVRDPRG